ncbi:hypothetical protein BAMA111019_07005 [Bacillus manliponensis]
MYDKLFLYVHVLQKLRIINEKEKKEILQSVMKAKSFIK